PAVVCGSPGDAEAAFLRTLAVGAASRFSSASTFPYSSRRGAPAATMDGQLRTEVVQERFERLIELQDRITFEENRALEGRAVEILVAEGEGARDAQTHRLSGRARDHRLVHFALPEGFPEAERPRPGDLVTATVTRAAPYYLIADSALGAPRRELGPERFSVRRTRSGDAWQAGELGLDTGGSCGTGGGAALSGPV